MTYHPGLPALAVTRVEETAERLVVRADLTLPPPADGAWRRHGWRTSEVWDVPHGRRQVQLVLRCPRYRCLASGIVVQPRPPWLDGDHRLTARAVEYLRAEWRHRPSAAVARAVGCAEQTVRRAVAADVAEFQAQYRPAAPRRLGLDECHLAGRARAVLSDLDGGRLVDLADGYAESDVERLLRGLGHPERVAVVVIDFTPRYLQAVRRVLGDVPVLIDRWHVEKQARDALEAAVRAHEAAAHGGRSTRSLRRRLRIDRSLMKKPLTKLTAPEKALLDVILVQNAGLAAAWAACQAFCALFEAESSAAAEAGYEAWRRSLPSAAAAAYRNVITLVNRYRTEVFGYCDYRATNGPAENLNGRLKKLSGLGGHQVPFPVFRARALMRFGGSPAAVAETGEPPRRPARQLTLF